MLRKNGKAKRVSLVDEFIALMRKEMDRQGMSISELARKAQIGRPYLHRVMNHEHSPSLEWVERVAAALGMEVTIQKIS